MDLGQAQGLLCLGLLAASCGGVDERAIDALIDEIEAIHTETVETIEEEERLTIERMGRPRCEDSRWNTPEEVEGLVERRLRSAKQSADRRLDLARQQQAERVGRLRDALERDAWDEVFRPGVNPAAVVGRAKDTAEKMLAAARESLELETSGVNERLWESQLGNAASLTPLECE